MYCVQYIPWGVCTFETDVLYNINVVLNLNKFSLLNTYIKLSFSMYLTKLQHCHWLKFNHSSVFGFVSIASIVSLSDDAGGILPSSISAFSLFCCNQYTYCQTLISKEILFDILWRKIVKTISS